MMAVRNVPAFVVTHSVKLTKSAFGPETAMAEWDVISLTLSWFVSNTMIEKAFDWSVARTTENQTERERKQAIHGDKWVNQGISEKTPKWRLLKGERVCADQTYHLHQIELPELCPSYSIFSLQREVERNNRQEKQRWSSTKQVRPSCWSRMPSTHNEGKWVEQVKDLRKGGPVAVGYPRRCGKLFLPQPSQCDRFSTRICNTHLRHHSNGKMMLILEHCRLEGQRGCDVV